MKRDKIYKIYKNGTLYAYGSANHFQIKEWEKAGYTVLRAI